MMSIGPHASAFMPERPRGRVHWAATWHYRPLRNLALHIIESYPPSQFHYVGIGRSPTPVMAMIQAILGESAATNIPLSSLNDLRPADEGLLRCPSREVYDPVLSREQDCARTYTPENLQLLHAHLQNFLPNPRSPEGTKEALFIDFADSGRSLTYLKREIDAHRETLPPAERRPSRFLALTHRWNGVRKSLAAEGIETLELRGRALSVIDTGLFKHLAEYASWRPLAFLSQTAEPITLEKARRLFRKGLKNSFWAEGKDVSWVRRSRRNIYQQYLDIEAYENLRTAFARRTSKDPLVLESIDATRRATVLQRAKISCDRLFDYVVDLSYQTRYKF